MHRVDWSVAGVGFDPEDAASWVWSSLLKETSAGPNVEH